MLKKAEAEMSTVGQSLCSHEDKSRSVIYKPSCDTDTQLAGN